MVRHGGMVFARLSSVLAGPVPCAAISLFGFGCMALTDSHFGRGMIGSFGTGATNDRSRLRLCGAEGLGFS